MRSAATERRLRSIESRGPARHAADPCRPLDAHDVGAEIAEDHRRVRARADAGQLDDSQSVQWSSHASTPSIEFDLS